MSHCEAIGDLPVYARDSSGAVVSFVLTNVRCVPSFKYTLLSVRQMWAEHRIDARFRDLERLELPNGKGNIPYDSAKRLYTITFVSNVMAEARLANSGHSDGRVPILATSPAAKRQCIQRAFVGFHAPTATAHIEKMSAAQASAFWHRRSHHGAGKVRKYADTTKGTPKNVSAAHAQTCPCCAQAHIKTASHSGSLDVTTLEPGTPPRLHGDYVEYQVRPQKLTRSMSPRRMIGVSSFRICSARAAQYASSSMCRGAWQ